MSETRPRHVIDLHQSFTVSMYYLRDFMSQYTQRQLQTADHIDVLIKSFVVVPQVVCELAACASTRKSEVNQYC